LSNVSLYASERGLLQCMALLLLPDMFGFGWRVIA